MRFRRQIVAIVLALVFAACVRAQVIEAVLVVVNGEPVLLSDWSKAVAMAALLTARPLSDFSDGEKRAILDGLIDQTLLWQQVRKTNIAQSSADVDAQMAELRASTQGASTEQGWSAVLTSYGLTGADVRAYLQRQTGILRFVELRFRPNVKPSATDIERYYADEYVPAMRKAGVTPVPAQTVGEQIANILAARTINRLTAAWLDSLRQGAMEWRMTFGGGEKVAARPGNKAAAGSE